MHLFYSLLVFSCLCINTILAQPALSLSHESSRASHREQMYHSTEDYSLAQLRNKAPSEIFEIANKSLANKDYANAIEAYRILNVVDPLGKHTEEAFANMIQAYHDTQDIDNVALHVSKFVLLYPTSQYLEKVYYLNASVYFRPQDYIVGFLYRLFQIDKLDPAYCIDLNELGTAIHYFTAFLEQFANGSYAEKARENIKTIHQLIARREYYIANFYFQLNNYIAAYNRITSLLDRYPDVHSVLPKTYVTNLDKQYHKTKQLLGLTSDLYAA